MDDRFDELEQQIRDYSPERVLEGIRTSMLEALQATREAADEQRRRRDGLAREVADLVARKGMLPGELERAKADLAKEIADLRRECLGGLEEERRELVAIVGGLHGEIDTLKHDQVSLATLLAVDRRNAEKERAVLLDQVENARREAAEKIQAATASVRESHRSADEAKDRIADDLRQAADFSTKRKAALAEEIEALENRLKAIRQLAAQLAGGAATGTGG